MWSELKQLFNFAKLDTNFIFNGSFYEQIDGVSMGSPLGPVLPCHFVHGLSQKDIWQMKINRLCFISLKNYRYFCFYGFVF